jgi:hypothetical protein
MPKNIFVVGLDDFNLQRMNKIRHARHYAFHRLLDFDAVARNPECDVDRLLEQAYATLDSFPGSIDAVVGFWDFPTVLMMPIIRRRYGLRGPSLESVLKCEHKYWARLLQQGAVPDLVPPFALVDPFADDAAERPPLAFPFWIKPVKAHSSILGYKVRNSAEYRHALGDIRERLRYFAVNLDKIMAHAEIPPELAHADGWKCIAEGIISKGRQCTLEGYVFEGKPEVYGIVDSIRGPNRISLERYQYPSTLPKPVQRRMIHAAKTVISEAGLEDSPFNMEFFWSRRSDRIWLLEVNARISKSHSPIFEMVEGVPHNEVMVDVALGHPPEYPLGQGAFRHAAKFMLRRYDLAGTDVIRDVPDADAIAAVERRHPGSTIHLRVEPGMRLKDLNFQDSYSFELADIFVGADSQSALLRAYQEIIDELPIEIGAAP